MGKEQNIVYGIEAESRAEKAVKMCKQSSQFEIRNLRNRLIMKLLSMFCFEGAFHSILLFETNNRTGKQISDSNFELEDEQNNAKNRENKKMIRLW